MHLEGPWLTTTGKIRSKRRQYASAAAAQQARDLREEWEQRQRDWNKLAPRFATKTAVDPNMPRGAFKPLAPSPGYPPGREPNNIPSRPDTPGAIGARPADKVYTGTAIKGIGVLHKSNAVPIFTDDEAVDIARMRR